MDVVNSEKIEETFGINGYYGDGQMMNWFAPPTTIQNVRGVDYESTPHGVPTDEFWWIKQNRYNRERIANNLQNTTVIYPSGLPSGDRLEDDYFNAEGDKTKFVFNTDFDWTSPAPECSKLIPPCSYMPMRRSFKKGDIIEGIVERNLGTSEPPNFFVSGGMRIGFGGRGTKIIIPYREPKVERKLESNISDLKAKLDRCNNQLITSKIDTTKTHPCEVLQKQYNAALKLAEENKPKAEPKVEPKEEPKVEPKVERVKVEDDKADDKILGMPKMVAIGVGITILAIGGFVVYKKFIK